jgi:ribosome-associated translation inhibitor RaiA
MLYFAGTAIGVSVRAFLMRESERQLSFATDRFRSEIRDIDVVFRDLNGPRGGVDKECKVTATLRGGGTLQIAQRSASFLEAIHEAARRLGRVLARHMDRKAKRRTIRYVRVPKHGLWTVQ